MTTALLVVVLVLALGATVLGLVVLRELRRVRARLEEVAGAGVTHEIEEAATAVRQHNQRQHRETRAVADALFSLSGLGPTGATFPSTQGFAASPMVLRRLAEVVTEHRAELIVELGSGGSSVLLGRLVRGRGHGRVVSLEQDAAYAEETRAHLRRHGVEDLVEVRVAPLVPVDVGGDTYQWYDPDAFDDLDGIDLMFVDGPPHFTGRLPRFPAVPLLAPRCSPGARVLLDDGARPKERRAADRWIADHGATEVASDDVGTGWIELVLP